MADRTVSVALQLKIAGFTNGLKKAQQDTQKFAGEFSAHAKKNKGDFDAVAGTVGGIGLAAAAGVGLAVKKFADFDKAMSNVKAATHETAGNMAELREAAIDAGAKTAFSATEAAEAIENLAKAGVSTRDILNGGLSGALDLAAAGELGVADAAEIAATAMTQFKLSGKDVPHIADLLAAGAGKAQGEVSDMAQALKQGGLVAAQMGLSIEETTGTLAAFASAGLIGSDAGTSFKTMLLALANPSEKAAGTMKDLGINAYDASGAFMGIAPLAEQLKAKLSNLSQEQRDSALATIFGSDAIRAAAVLYNQGAEGIADWTTKVNDQGFAAETAAIKTDNLKGDIERLGGSIDTALIKTGSGANDALRGLAQGAGLLVDGITGLPDIVQKVGVGLGSVAAVGGLSAAGLLKAASAAGEAREAWQGLGKTGRTLTLSMGAVGIAITAGLVLYGAFTKQNAKAKEEAENLRQTLDEQTGAITGNTRAYVANELAQNGLAEKAKGFGLSLKTVTDAALGNKGALDSVVASLDEITKSNIITNSGIQSGVVRYNEQGEAARKLKEQLIGTNSALTDAQKKQKLAAEGAGEVKTAQEIQTEAVAKANEEIREQTASLDDQIKAMQQASGQAISLAQSQIDYQEALAGATEAIEENGRSVDRKTGKLRLDTKEGRDNQKALIALAQAANDQTEAMIRNGTSNDAVRATSEAARKKFVQVATQMGLNKTEANKLSQEYFDIPDKVDTKVTNDAPDAKQKAFDYHTLLGVTPKTKDTKFTTSGIPTAEGQVTSFADAITTKLDKIGDESVKVSLTYVASLQGGRLGRNPEGFHDGGPVTGGIAGRDSVEGLLMPGEHVLTTKDVDAMGGQHAVYDFRRQLHRYAAGGAVRLETDAPTAAEIAATQSSIARAMGKDIAAHTPGAPGGPPGSARNFRGKRLNDRTIAMLLNAERILGSQFHITQGSYSTSVAASGSTHAGGGAMDTNGPRGWANAVRALRLAGFAAWHRTPAQGPWGHHIHSIARGDSSSSGAAKRQVQDYERGGDGLGGGASRNTPKFSQGGVVKATSYDQGGMLPTGPSFVYNGTGRPEPVGHDFLKKSDLDGMVIQLDAGDVTFTGHIRTTAQGVVNESNRQIKRRVATGGR